MFYVKEGGKRNLEAIYIPFSVWALGKGKGGNGTVDQVCVSNVASCRYTTLGLE